VSDLQTQNLSYRNFILGYLAWWLSWTVLQTLALQHTVGLNWGLAIYDSAMTNALLGLAGYTMITVMRFYRPRQILRFTWSVGLAIVCTLTVKWGAHECVGDEAYIRFVEQSAFLRGLFGWLMISLVTVISWMWFYMREQQETESRKANTEKLAREAELSKLRQQLQPHFLFNSLNSISALAGSRPEEARKMIQQLSDFLRGTIKRDDQQLVTLEEELTHLQLYLDIEKVRFGHRLKTEIENSMDALPMLLPSLLLQPIVENAIKFGLYDTTGEITIRISAHTEPQHLVLTVENPFDPSTSQPRRGTGFGLNSVQRRLHLLYARQDLLTTRQNENIFITQVRIPQNA
jgi:two-component sensor histidine kinase